MSVRPDALRGVAGGVGSKGGIPGKVRGVVLIAVKVCAV